MTDPRRVGGSNRAGRRPRRVGAAILTAVVALLLSAVWLAVTSVMANNQLNQVRADAHTLGAQISASNWTAARATSADLEQHAHRTNQLTSGPIWALAAALPGGEPLQTIRGISAGVDTLGHEALPLLVDASQRLDPRTLRRPDGSIDIARIAAVAPAIATASAAVAGTTKSVAALPHHTWMRSIDAAYADALSKVTALDESLKSAGRAVKMVPSMLGQNGPKRYFLAFQNEAEARGTGGLPGAFAIVEANHGQVSLARLESDRTLSGISADVDLGPDYHDLYGGANTTTLYANGNLSPNFPYPARIWASMWKAYSGEQVDGVMAVDPTALSYLLAVTGPATLPDKSHVSRANAVRLTQSASYARFPGTTKADAARRQGYLLEIAFAASMKILGVRGDPTALLRAAGKAAGERRILVWSADPVVQANLAQTSVSGIIPSTATPYVGLSIVNDGGNKLDYYLDRSLTWQRTGCGPTRQTTVTVKLTNNAPASGLSPYVTARSDDHGYPIKPGDNRLAVSYFATQGAEMDAVTVAGKPGTSSIGVERGHPVFTVDVELPRGTSRTIVMHLTEPAGTGSPIVLRQPLVRPFHVKLLDTHCN